MDSFSIVVDGPDILQLQEALLPKFDGYRHEIFDYDRGNVVTIAIEKYYFRTNSNLLAVITIDGTAAGKCLVDIISGGGGTGLLTTDCGSERNAINKVLGMFDEIGEEQGWTVREYKTPAVSSADQVQPDDPDYDGFHHRSQVSNRHYFRGRRDRCFSHHVKLGRQRCQNHATDVQKNRRMSAP
jgi:hypothetical protein